MKKPNVRKQINEAKSALKSVMQENLTAIAESIIEKVVAKIYKLPDARRFDAIKDINPSGLRDYSTALLAALATIAYSSLKQARTEVPKKSKIKLSEWNENALMLGEWEKLPAAVRARLDKQNKLLVATQLADLEKAIYFQFGHSIDSTDSVAMIAKDLRESADDYVTGAAIEGGASATAASVINEARTAFFFDEEVLSEVEAFEFVNGDPVSDICTDLAGSIFAKDDPEAMRYTPPLHWGCKSFISPILVGNLGNREITGLKPSTKKLEGSIQFSENVFTPCASCGSHFGASSETVPDPKALPA